MIEEEKINPTATGTEVPSYGLFSFIGKSLAKNLGQRGGLFDQAKQNTKDTFGTAPKIGGGGGIFNWMKGNVMKDALGIAPKPAPAPSPSPSGGGMFGWFKNKVLDDLNNQGTFKAPLPFGGSAEVRIPTPQPSPQPAPAPAQKSYRDFDWSDYNADRQTMDVDERDQYYDNYKRDRDFWGNYYNRQPSMPQPIQTLNPYGPPRGNYVTDRGGMSYTDMDTGINHESGTGPRDQRMEQDRMRTDDMGELTVMPKEYNYGFPQRQGFFGRPIRREPSYGGFGGGLRSLLGGLIGGGLGSIMPRPRGGLGGLFGGMSYRPQPRPRMGGLGSLFRGLF